MEYFDLYWLKVMILFVVKYYSINGASCKFNLLGSKQSYHFISLSNLSTNIVCWNIELHKTTQVAGWPDMEHNKKWQSTGITWLGIWTWRTRNYGRISKKLLYGRIYSASFELIYNSYCIGNSEILWSILNHIFWYFAC